MMHEGLPRQYLTCINSKSLRGVRDYRVDFENLQSRITEFTESKMKIQKIDRVKLQNRIVCYRFVDGS